MTKLATLILFCLTLSASAMPAWVWMQISTAGPGNGYIGYFVDTNGNDTINGINGLSPTQPFKTITNAVAQAALTGTNLIQVTAGQWFTNTPVLITSSVTLTNKGPGQFIVSNMVSKGDDIDVTNASLVNIYGALVTGATNGLGFNNGISIRYTGSHLYTNGTISGCVVENTGQNPIALPSTQQGGFDILINDDTSSSDSKGVVTNCVVRNSYTDGVFAWNDNNNRTVMSHNGLTVINSTFSNIYGNGQLTAGIPIAIGMATNWTVFSNSVTGYGQQATNVSGGPGGIVVVFSSHGMAASNSVSYGYTTKPLGSVMTDGIGIDSDIDSDNCVWMFNTISFCQGAGILDYSSYGQNTYAYNTILHCGSIGGAFPSSAVLLSSSSGRTNFFYNNTIISDGIGVTDSSTASTTNVWANNIVVSAAGNGDAQMSQSNWFFGGNLWYSQRGGFQVVLGTHTFSTLATFQTAGYDKTAQNKDPWLYAREAIGSVTNFIPYNVSTVINGATNLTTTYGITPPGNDILGNPVTAATMNIGAINTNLAVSPSSLMTNLAVDYPFYSFEGTNVYDISGNGWQGWTTNNAPATNFVNTYGINFNGLNQYAVSGASNIYPMTLSVWVQGYGTMASRWDAAGGSESFLIESNLAAFSVSGATANVQSNAVYGPYNAAKNVTVTWNGTTVTVYTNGVVQSTGAQWFTTAAFVQFTHTVIGAQGWLDGPTSLFQGNEALYTEWSRVLTANEVSTNYLQTRDLKGYPWK